MPIGFKAVKPDIYDVEAFTRAAKSGLDRVGRGMLADFEKTTATWDHKPQFFTSTQPKASGYNVVVGTNDKIYGYVDQGTRPHVIRPRRGRALSFRSGYKAKTSPRKIGSGAGGARGGRRFARYVRHPGTKAREFSDEISKRWRNPSVRLLQDAFSDVVKGFVRR